MIAFRSQTFIRTCHPFVIPSRSNQAEVIYSLYSLAYGATGGHVDNGAEVERRSFLRNGHGTEVGSRAAKRVVVCDTGQPHTIFSEVTSPRIRTARTPTGRGIKGTTPNPHWNVPW